MLRSIELTIKVIIFSATWSIGLSLVIIRGPFERFVDWRQCAAVMQREAVPIIIPICSDKGNIAVA
jgi:hypothetical protein